MSIVEYEDKILELVNGEENNNFIYKFLDIYKIPKATITRLKSGNQNLSKVQGEVHLKNRVWFKETKSSEHLKEFVKIEEYVNELTSKPRYIIVTDYKKFLAKDTKTLETINIEFKELPRYFSFFLAWNGIEKIDFENENPADIKAAERFARIFDIVKKENTIEDTSTGNDIFFIRLLFCMFAEDTDIFERGSFSNSIKTLTKKDGTDLNQFFKDLFRVLDQKERAGVSSHLSKFPYVNGQLFREEHQDYNFSVKSRKLIIECGELLNWAKINPDIFGSMVQAVSTNENRSTLGKHYTSVPNIMKVIKPLFLDELNRTFEKSFNNIEKLDYLYDRIGKIKFFDPACGSGNFLIITYKELRRLEIKILLRKRELTENLMYLPSVTLDQFHGIEIDDFAHDVAKLSLWITEHQMNMELEEIFDAKVRATLPLQDVGDIRHGNALEVEWKEVCPIHTGEEVYVFGNPPYLGSKKQNPEQRREMNSLFSHVKHGSILDYISAWFKLGAKYSNDSNAKVAFVSTNSITHGEQVYPLWSELYKFNIEINFAYQSFKWTNNAKGKANVIVVIIGFSQTGFLKDKILFANDTKEIVDNINPYLVKGDNVLVNKRPTPISHLPKLRFGNMPNDGGGLIFSVNQYNDAIMNYPSLKQYFKKLIGSEEFINDSVRYCLWIDKEDYSMISHNKLIQERILITKTHRLNSRDKSTNKLALTPWKFRDTHETIKHSILIPLNSSENRNYIPMGLVDSKTVVSNSAGVIYDAELYILGVLMSKMHMSWVKAVAGRLKTDYRYSERLCYNTFPLPNISTRRKNEIKSAIIDILDIREEHGSSLAELYNPQKMPEDLKACHKKLDEIIDKTFKRTGFANDDERASHLFELYRQFIEHEVVE